MKKAKDPAIVPNKKANRFSVQAFFFMTTPLSVSVFSSRTIQDPKNPFTLYTIRVKWGAAVAWTLDRRFHDFAALHAILATKSQLLPPMPEKTWFKSFDPEFVEKRRVGLDGYLRKLVEIRVVLASMELRNFLDLSQHIGGLNEMVPSERIILKDPKFGINTFVYDHPNGILFTCCEDSFVLSRLDSYIANVRMPWEEKGATVPIGALNVWLRDSANDWSCVSSLYFDCQASFLAWDNVKQHLFVGCETGAVLIYVVNLLDERNAKLVSFAEFKHHDNRITGIFFDASKQHLICASRDKTVSIYDVAQMRLVSITQCGSAWISALYCDVSSKRLFLGNYANSILIYDLDVADGESLRLITTLEGHKGSIRSLWYDPASRYCFAGCFDWSIVMWDIGQPGKETTRSRQVAQMKTGPPSKCKAVIYCPSTRFIIGGYENGMIAVYDSRTAELLHVIEAHTGDIVQLQWLDNFRILISGSRDCDIKFWLFPEELARFPLPALESATEKVISVSSRVVATTSNLVTDSLSIVPIDSEKALPSSGSTQISAQKQTVAVEKPGYFFQNGQFASVKLHTAPEYANIVMPAENPKSIEGKVVSTVSANTSQPTKPGSSITTAKLTANPVYSAPYLVNTDLDGSISSNIL